MLLLSCPFYWDTYERGEIQKLITQSQKDTDFIIHDDPTKEQKMHAAFLSRRESIAGETPISLTEDTSMPYSEFKSTRDYNCVITTILGGAAVIHIYNTITKEV
ncbi:hypothetical protein TNCV_4171951 [Trichonephila clavipes]|nr:hypothetical protein TNCV_4171951 [Trichonephila clavipes]